MALRILAGEENETKMLTERALALRQEMQLEKQLYALFTSRSGSGFSLCIKNGKAPRSLLPGFAADVPNLARWRSFLLNRSQTLEFSTQVSRGHAQLFSVSTWKKYIFIVFAYTERKLHF